MSRIALVAPIALAVLAFAGCQSEEEKLKEKAALKQELITEIKSDLTYTIQVEADRAVKQAVEDHKRRQMEEAAKAAAAKPVKAGPGSTPVKVAPTKAAPKKR